MTFFIYKKGGAGFWGGSQQLHLQGSPKKILSNSEIIVANPGQINSFDITCIFLFAIYLKSLKLNKLVYIF